MNLHKIIICISMLCMMTLCMMGCTNKVTDKEPSETLDSQEDTEQTKEDLYLILENNMSEEILTLYSYKVERQFYYHYDYSTEFCNKYGGYESSANFTPGRVIEVVDKNSKGQLVKVQLSDAVWEYEKVKRFSYDAERGVFVIADTNYSIRDNVYIFSNGDTIKITDISDNDILTVVGMDNKILSINVTTGQGTLSLKNTKLFEGSLLKLNSDRYIEVEKNMKVEIPEGTYTLTVANDGWGGTTEITITRGKTTTVDLDTLKGPGKKKGKIKFDINTDKIELYVDYKLVDHTKVQELTYGTHRIEIRADKETVWKKNLVVNSAQATIVIEIEEETEKETEKESQKETEKETEKESEKETEKESETETEKETEKESETETEKETEKESEKETEKESETETEKESETETQTETQIQTESAPE